MGDGGRLRKQHKSEGAADTMSSFYVIRIETTGFGGWSQFGLWSKDPWLTIERKRISAVGTAEDFRSVGK